MFSQCVFYPLFNFEESFLTTCTSWLTSTHCTLYNVAYELSHSNRINYNRNHQYRSYLIYQLCYSLLTYIGACRDFMLILLLLYCEFCAMKYVIFTYTCMLLSTKYISALYLRWLCFASRRYCQ